MWRDYRIVRNFVSSYGDGYTESANFHSPGSQYSTSIRPTSALVMSAGCSLR